MKVQYLASACVLVEHKDIKVLCDPWLEDGVYYGSWYHYPPLKFTPEDFSDVDYIYISHIHPDHMDIESLKRLPKSIPILIHNYAEKFIMRILKGIGFEKVIELAHQEPYRLAEDFTVEILSADNCDPEICGKFFGCSILTPYEQTIQIDSLAVFNGAGKTVVNSNDCPYELSYKVCDYIMEKYGSIDFLLVGYAGAGPFPQCFENLNDAEKLEKANAKRDQFLNQSIHYLKHLKPAYFLPFAGQYTLGGKLAKLNPFRGVPELEELEEAFSELLLKNKISSKMILLNREEWFDVVKGVPSAPFTPANPVERQKYIDDVLIHKKYLYESDEYYINEKDRFDLTEKLKEAHARMLKHQDKNGKYRSNWKVYIDAGQGFLYYIPFDGVSEVTKVKIGEEVEPFVRIKVDYSLLNMILSRKAHWNNAEIGSHLTYYRQPEAFERGIYHFLSYLHC